MIFSSGAQMASHAPAPASYRVRSGDTLSLIAEEAYGNADDWPKVWKDNPQITDPDLIYTGSLVKLPGEKADPAKVASAQVPPVKNYTPRHSTANPVTVSPQPAVPASGNAAQIAGWFEGHGFTAAAADGITADIFGESGGNPESQGDGGFGLIGWTGNTTGLAAGYAGPTGDPARDMAIQLEGVIGYIQAEGGSGVLNAQSSALGAAQVFSAQFERPAVTYSDIDYQVLDNL